MSNDNDTILTNKSIRCLIQKMGESAIVLSEALSAEQRKKAFFPFEDVDNRTFWDYIPLARQVLPLGEMDKHQRRCAHKLVASGLSGSGYVTTTTIMGLETALDARENWSSNNWRDTGDYYISLFGSPSEKDPWGWKFEGHHISINYTMIGDQIVAPTPFFFGANPASAALNNVGYLRPLGNVENLARELMHNLNEEQQHHAIISPVPPGDIVTVNQSFIRENSEKPDRLNRTSVLYDTVRYTISPKGLAGIKMNESQKEILTNLIGQYIQRMPDAIAESEYNLLEENGLDDVHLAWAGGITPCQPHYYRLQSGRFLVEYDNVQNDANHIHSVWRNPSNDFGSDLLGHHYHNTHNSGIHHHH